MPDRFPGYGPEFDISKAIEHAIEASLEKADFVNRITDAIHRVAKPSYKRAESAAHEVVALLQATAFVPDSAESAADDVVKLLADRGIEVK